MASSQPAEAARGLRKVVDSFKRSGNTLGRSMASFGLTPDGRAERTVPALLGRVGELMQVVRQNTPLVHQVRGKLLEAPEAETR